MDVSYKYIKMIFYGYLIVITSGAFLLSLPFAHIGELGLIDALFTSASATCVTGLIVVSTSENFTFFGEMIILALIQIGGIGYMTLVTFFFLYLKKDLSIDDKKMMKQSLELPTLNVNNFTKKILALVLIIELVGALILTVEFTKTYAFTEAVWYGVFHAISAFNNAGFSLFTDSLMGYNSNTTIMMTICLLVIVGGIGYFVLIEVLENRKSMGNFSVHSKIMIYGTLFLLLFGTVLFLSLEWDNQKTFAEFSIYEKILNAFFLSVNFRTSGFNSIDIGMLNDSSLFFSTLLMITGGGQGGTAGGIKVTTVAVLIVALIYVLRDNNQEPNIFKRTIDQRIINKALAIIMFASFLVLFSTLLLVETQDLPFLKILFEVVSAFATVGVSVGNGDILSLSEKFDTFGKGIIILLMIAGRVGVFAFGVILVGKSRKINFKYPKGRILI
ncbi:MAG: TrkH family potassium uptake protein [Arcobacteraceae bacterium]|nr:TrkH family potassium uptake protein [Arcobacteraceae bacterium]